MLIAEKVYLPSNRGSSMLALPSHKNKKKMLPLFPLSLAYNANV